MFAESSLAHVIVVDDEPMIRQFVSSVLSTSGYQVSDAGTSDQALQIMDKTPDVDLLVTDIVMPGGTGWELADSMRKRKPGLPVLFISGYAPDTFRTVSEESFLRKPFRITELLERVRVMLGQEVSQEIRLPAGDQK